MNSDKLYRAHLQFIGKVIAICTHDIRNHLAIIRESTGLIMDTLEFSRSKLQGIEISKPLNNIDKQALKSSSFLALLSSFCHRLDHESSVFSINQLIDELLTLLNRNLIQREIEVAKDYSENIQPIEGHPAILQFLLFCIIEKIENKGALQVITTDSNTNIQIILKYEQGLKDGSNDLMICTEALIEEACSVVSAQVKIGPKEYVLTLNKAKGGKT